MTHSHIRILICYLRFLFVNHGPGGPYGPGGPGGPGGSGGGRGPGNGSQTLATQSKPIRGTLRYTGSDATSPFKPQMKCNNANQDNVDISSTELVSAAHTDESDGTSEELNSPQQPSTPQRKIKKTRFLKDHRTAEYSPDATYKLVYNHEICLSQQYYLKSGLRLAASVNCRKD